MLGISVEFIPVYQFIGFLVPYPVYRTAIDRCVWKFQTRRRVVHLRLSHFRNSWRPEL